MKDINKNIMKEKVVAFFVNIKNVLHNKWYSFVYKCQRFHRGFSDKDSWDVPEWFISVAKPLLKRFLKYTDGYPLNVSKEQWHDELTEMIACLNLMDSEKARKHLGISKKDESKEAFEKTYKLMDDSKNRFFELFSKRFWSLWY